jgi:hypothetical protein
MIHSVSTITSKKLIDIYDQCLKTKIEEYMLQEDQEYVATKKRKDSFWASETEKPLFDIYHQWNALPVTNPIDAEKLIMFSAAKMMELALVGKLQKMGLAKKGGDQFHFLIEREGVPISGYTDCIFVDGTVGEVKSFYGDYMTRDLQAGKPRTSNLKQLAVYLDAVNQDRGKLIYMDRGSGAMYEFTLLREGDTRFKCMNIEFDLKDTYTKWRTFYDNHILRNAEPDPFECGLYKADVETLDWTKVSKSNISAARTGKKVIGSDMENHWKILYSPYKTLWIQKMGQTLGYTDVEIKRIKELTKNYSSNKK